MKITLPGVLILLCLTAASAWAESVKVTPLLTKDLTGIPGKEGLLVVVEYGPGEAGIVHRHNAHVFVYVLEGSIVMQVKGGQPVTLGPGQTFYETPQDVHAVGKNASHTKSVKFLAFFVKDQGAPVSMPLQ